jgi:hypothetical protein|tara:strand:- start:1340 stop:3649 length:2310 start_codon:yes stop_codon:yes gene_type:complete
MGYDNLPRQKLSINKKNKEWREACVDGYIDLSTNTSSMSTRRDELAKYYDLYNGVVDESDYDSILKPYGKARKNFPSSLRNFPIIKPIIDLLLGEKAKRPLNFTVSVLNADAVTRKEDAKNEKVLRNLKEHFVQAANAAGIDTGIDPKEVDLPEHVEALFNNTYVDNRAIVGQNAMNYIMATEEVKDKLDKAWFHYLVSGEVYTHRGVRQNDPFYEILNPMDVDYDLDPDLEFVEDGDWAIVRKFVHASTLVDYFHDELSDEEMLSLEEPHGMGNSHIPWMSMNSTSPNGNQFNNRLIELITVYWKSRKRIGFVSFPNPETGEMEEMEVEDGFKMPAELKEAGARIEWLWVNEVWGGHKVDGRLFIDIAPLPNQRTSLDNPSLCKLPINGRRYSDTNSDNISLVSLGMPYQLTYNVYKYRLELAIARSKGIIAQFDINMIPKKWDMDKFMHFVEGTGIAWVDYNKEGVQLSPQHQSVLDMSIKTIEQYIVLLNSVMEEWEKLSGVNRQRQGQVGAYEGKSTSQQAIIQSSHITEDLFRKFNRMEQRDMQALLDYSKEAWIKGKKTSFVMPDGTTDFLDVESMGHMESEYGLWVTDSGEEQEKIEAAKQLGQAMIQNGLPTSAVLEMLDSKSFIQIKSNIKKAEANMQELEKAQQEAAQQQEQAQMQQAKEIVENENVNNEKDREVKIKVAEISAGVTSDKNLDDADNKDRELDLKEREVELKERESGETSRSNKANETIDSSKISASSKNEDKKLAAAKQKENNNKSKQ